MKWIRHNEEGFDKYNEWEGYILVMAEIPRVVYIPEYGYPCYEGGQGDMASPDEWDAWMRIPFYKK